MYRRKHLCRCSGTHRLKSIKKPAPGWMGFGPLLLVLLLAGLPVHLAKAAEISLLPAGAELPKLKKGHGYLLVNLEVSGPAPSLEIKSQRYSKREISLKNKKPGFYFAPLRKGEYQITRVRAPYFDLPYHMDTSERKGWAFVIEEGRTNYIGRLYIDKERSTSSVDVRMLNRFATDKKDIEGVMDEFLQAFPIVLGQSFRDDFLDELLSEE